MHFLLALLLAAAPIFPWSAYSDIPQARVISDNECGGAAAVLVLTPEWKVLSGETRDVFIHITDGVVDFVYLTEGVAKGNITVKHVLSLEDVKALYPDPCQWIVTTSA